MLPVIIEGGRVDVIYFGISKQRGIEGVELVAGVEGNQIIFRSLLVGRANTPVSTAWKSEALEIDRFLGRRRFGHIHDNDHLAAQFFD